MEALFFLFLSVSLTKPKSLKSNRINQHQPIHAHHHQPTTTAIEED